MVVEIYNDLYYLLIIYLIIFRFCYSSWFSRLCLSDFPYSNWLRIASFSLDDLIKKHSFVRTLTHMLHTYSFYVSVWSLCIFYVPFFLFWFFGSKSRESLVLSFGGKRMMYCYQCFCLNIIPRINDAFIDYTSSFVKKIFYEFPDLTNSLLINVLTSTHNEILWYSTNFLFVINCHYR